MRAGDVADVQARPGLPGQRAVAGHDRLLGGGGPAREAQPRRHLPFVRLRAPGEPVVLGVLGDHDVERRGVLQRPAHDQRIVHAAAVVGEHPHLRGRAGHRAELGHPLAAQADGDGADRVHVDEPDLGTAAAHVQRDDVGVDDRSGVGHREHGGEPAERGRRRARRDRLGLLAARLAQVGVQVDEPRQQDEPVGVERLVGGEPGPDLRHHAVAHQDVDRLALAVRPGTGDHQAHSGAPARRW